MGAVTKKKYNFILNSWMYSAFLEVVPGPKTNENWPSIRVVPKGIPTTFCYLYFKHANSPWNKNYWNLEPYIYTYMHACIYDTAKKLARLHNIYSLTLFILQLLSLSLSHKYGFLFSSSIISSKNFYDSRQTNVGLKLYIKKKGRKSVFLLLLYGNEKRIFFS